MKIKSILLAALIAFGFAACNNEDAPDLGKQAEGTVTVKVLPSSKGGSRLVGDIDGSGVQVAGLGEESKIVRLEVFVYDDSSKKLDGYGESATNVVEKIATHAGEKIIVVVANATTAIGPVANYADLKAKTSALPVAAVVDNGEITLTNGLVMTGESTVVKLDAGDNQFGYKADDDGYKASAKQLSSNTPLPITRVNARVAIADAKLSISDPAQQALFDGLKDVEVAIFNVPQETNIFGDAGTLTADVTKFYFGNAWPTTANSYVGSADSDDNGEANTAFVETGFATLPIGITDAPYFYVTENVKEGINPKEQMLIVLRGVPTLNNVEVEAEGLYTDEEGYTYYPVWVNKDGIEDGTGKVVRNTQYNIYLTIKGMGNPSIDEVEEAFLDVLVKVEDWEVVTQDVTWQ